MKKRDSLDRRFSFAPPQPYERGLALSPRDYVIFEKLDRHGLLPTHYIHEFVKPDPAGRHSLHALKTRLARLYHGYVNKNGRTVSYVTRDPRQLENFNARYQSAIYGLSRHGKLALVNIGLGNRYLPAKPGNPEQFVHEFFRGCFGASFELLAPPHTFKSADGILAHQSCPDDARRLGKIGFPVSIPDISFLVPDDLLALEYQTGGFRFFAVEIDRNTESINPRKPVKNSIAKKVKGYIDVLTFRTHHSWLGIPNLTVLFPTTNQRHAENIIDYIKESVEPRFHKHFLAKAFTEFGEPWHVPKGLLAVFDPWLSPTGLVDIRTK